MEPNRPSDPLALVPLSGPPAPPAELPAREGIRPSQLALAATIGAVAAGSLAYRLLVHARLEQTAALFIGLPAFLAAALALAPRAKSLIGMILKGMTIALLASGIFLGEGFICILMASPLFYTVGILIGVIIRAIDGGMQDRSKAARRGAYGAALVPFLPLSLEGVTSRLSFARDEVVRVDRVVAAPTAEVERALSRAPTFDRPLPAVLRLGFPRPVATAGAGLEPGARRTVKFAGGEGKPGDLVAEVVDRAPGRVRFRAVSDTSAIAHWLAWQEAAIEWTAVDRGATRVEITVRYRRLLDPAWYFGPWERYAVGLAAEHLIDAAASPAHE